MPSLVPLSAGLADSAVRADAADGLPLPRRQTAHWLFHSWVVMVGVLPRLLGLLVVGLVVLLVVGMGAPPFVELVPENTRAAPEERLGEIRIQVVWSIRSPGRLP